MEQMNFIWQITLSDIFMIVLTLAYVVTTIFILKSSTRHFRETIRPKVYVDFRFKKGIMYVVVKNMGERAAHNIKIEFIPDIQYHIGSEDRSLNTTPLINNLSFLGPKNEIDSLIGAGHAVLPNQQDSLKATISYESECGKKKYKEEHSFSLIAYSKRLYSPEKDIGDIVKGLDKIEQTIKRSSGQAGRNNG
jgi:hypothetical protein